MSVISILEIPNSEGQINEIYLEAIDAYNNNKFDSALVKFDELLFSDENNVDLLNWKAQTLFALGKIPEMLPVLEKAYDLDNQNAVTVTNLGIFYNESGEKTKAMEYYLLVGQ